MHHELQTLRGKAFFWIGLGILPVFWLPWMRRGDFSANQILIAKIWTVLFLVMTGIAWHTIPVFQNGVLSLPLTYSHVAVITGLVLMLWLLLRMVSAAELIFILFILGGPIAGVFLPAMRQLEPHPASLLFVVIPALLHLWMTSEKSGRPNEN